jgi:predicted enzyme related to lactoylglutathione lyase
MPNQFAHIELTTVDLKAAQKFYSKIFAWKLNEMPGMSYTMIDVGNGQQGAGGGMQAKPMPEAPTGWMPYVQVDDVKATVAKAAKAGATVMLPYQEIGEMGAIGIFADPQGCAIGVWETKAGAAPPPPAVEAEPAAAKKAPAKKAPAKKAAAPAKKAAAKKAAAPAPAKKAPAKKGAAAPAPAAKKAPAKKKKA